MIDRLLIALLRGYKRFISPLLGPRCRFVPSFSEYAMGAIERYGVENSSYPTNLSDLNTPAYFPQGIPTCPVSGAAYSMNTTTYRIDGHTSSTVPGDH